MEVKEHIWVPVISQTYICKAAALVDGPYFIVNLELEMNSLCLNVPGSGTQAQTHAHGNGTTRSHLLI